MPNSDLPVPPLHVDAGENPESSGAFPDLPIFTGGGLQPGIDLDNNALIEEMLA
jgi:hypothetical protein